MGSGQMKMLMTMILALGLGAVSAEADGAAKESWTLWSWGLAAERLGDFELALKCFQTELASCRPST